MNLYNYDANPLFIPNSSFLTFSNNVENFTRKEICYLFSISLYNYNKKVLYFQSVVVNVTRYISNSCYAQLTRLPI